VFYILIFVIVSFCNLSRVEVFLVTYSQPVSISLTRAATEIGDSWNGPASFPARLAELAFVLERVFHNYLRYE
jgi:hypothetical protein